MTSPASCSSRRARPWAHSTSGSGWAYVQECGYGGELKVRNSLIAMYSRCGCVKKAYRVFCEIPQKSVASWTVMISGLAANGFGEDAISAFEEMIR